ncbi:MAG: Zn-dependent hydrolase [Gemmataceae bacterium]|nr:Zn-dependent hydrolase [Gemmataceae bacterium]
MTRSAFLLAGLVTLAPLAAPGTPNPARAQEPEKKVTLRWYGQSFFQIETSGGQKIVIDPHAIPTFGTPRVSAGVVLISHEHNDHNQPEVLEDATTARVFRGLIVSKDGRKTDWNRVDEKVLQTRVRSLATYHDAVSGMQRGKNTVWVVEADGLVFCHLGDLGHQLTPEQVKAVGKVDVLMVPVGGIYTINGEVAKKVVDQIKPRLYVLPMHYGVPGYDDILGPDEFLEGQKNKKMLPDTNELVIPLDAKTPDAPTVVVLGWKKADPVAPPKKP